MPWSAGKVAVEPLDDILAKPNVAAVRLMKIDVEGLEPKVLRGATDVPKLEPVICMEVSATVDSGDDEPLAAHNIIMSTALYEPYCSMHGKGPNASCARRGDSAHAARNRSTRL